MRFLLHMFVVSFLAPATGCAVFNFVNTDWSNSMFLERLLASIIGGFLLLVFIWFMVIPFGLFTYVICGALHNLEIKNRIIWTAGATVIGWAFGLYLGFWSGEPMASFQWSGAIIGAASGLALHKIWFAKWISYETN